MLTYILGAVDNNPARSAIAIAAGNNLCQLCNDGSIYRYLGVPARWDQIDDSPAAIAIVADGNMIYKLHNNGSVYRYDSYEPPSWPQLGSDANTVAIAASNGALTALTRAGSILQFSGTPFDWLLLDENPATVAIASAGGHLYQLHRDGSIWEYEGTPLTGWTALDSNGASVSIAADGDDLYQLHNDGSVWQFDRTATTWSMIGDPNGFVTFAIVAGAGTVLQLQNNDDNDVYTYTGTPHTGWEPIFDSAKPFRAIAAGVPQGADVELAANTPTGIYQVDTNGRLAEFMGIQDI